MKTETFYLYRVGPIREISKELCTKETDKTIWYINKNGMEVRELKDRAHISWHKTYEDARRYIIDKFDESINAARSNMEYLIEQKQKFENENS